MFSKATLGSYAAVFKRLATHPGARKVHTHPDYLLGPGMHLPSSPVVGSRCHDFNKLSYAVMTHPLLKELGRKIYDIKYRLIIPKQEREKANRIARDIFLDYIKMYAPYGVTESNIVNWIITKQSDSQFSGHCTILIQENIRYVDISVEADNGANGCEKGYFTPPHIVAYHEVMHAEEYKKSLVPYARGSEIMTTIKSIMLLDEVYKKIYRVNMGDEVNYKKSIVINKRKIQLGTFANFYRLLEKEHSTLADAIISTQSLMFLESGVDSSQDLLQEQGEGKAQNSMNTDDPLKENPVVPWTFGKRA